MTRESDRYGAEGRAWRCRSCGQVLGVGVGTRLVLSVGVAVEDRTRLMCRACGRWQTWYPPGGEGERRMPLFTLGD